MLKGILFVKVIPALAVLFVALCVPVPLASQEKGQQVVLARVNEKLITRRDVNTFLTIRGDLVRISRTYHGEELEKQKDKAFKRVLGFLISDAVIEMNAKLDKFKLSEMDKKRADAILEEEIKDSGNLANYKHILAQVGITIEDRKAMINSLLLKQRYIAQKLPPDDFIPPSETRGYYEENKPAFSRQETVTLRQIVIKFGTGKRNRKEALVLVANVRRSLSEGADFETLARQFSEGVMKDKGGLWPPAPPSGLRKNIAQAVASLKEGEVAETVEREGELLIIKLEKRDSTSYEPFAVALEKIKQQISTHNKQKRFPEMEKELFSRVEIVLFMPGVKLEDICPGYVSSKQKKNSGDKPEESSP